MLFAADSDLRSMWSSYPDLFFETTTTWISEDTFLPTANKAFMPSTACG